MRKKYKEHKFRSDKLSLINIINGIVEDYEMQGYNLTLRQIYYQLVARDYIENTERSYKTTGKLINDARMAGYIDWSAIEDRTRNLMGKNFYESPAELIRKCEYSHNVDLWLDQSYHVEVWVEKEALAGIVGKAARNMSVDYFSCRGYVSQSEMWNSAMRLMRYQVPGENKKPVIIYLGDHDPSGLDMTRDIEERLNLFGVDKPIIRRIALNKDQIDLYNPPPNPAKITDSRAKSYIRKHGHESWELDALSPQLLDELITKEITRWIDNHKAYDLRISQEKKERGQIREVAQNWKRIVG